MVDQTKIAFFINEPTSKSHLRNFLALEGAPTELSHNPLAKREENSKIVPNSTNLYYRQRA